MLQELAVRDLGIIERSTVAFGAGLTAITGETGAGKTLIVEALELLLGARADAGLVRRGVSEARVDGRFLHPETGDEVVLSRVVPAAGRSRAYIDGRPAGVAELAAVGSRLVDLQSQHSQQALLGAAGARAALDTFGGRRALDARRAHRAAYAARRELDAQLAALGGDDRTRARELDLLRYQLEEITALGIEDPDEDATLEREIDILSDAAAHQEALAAAHRALAEPAADAVRTATASLTDRPFPEAAARLVSLQAEVDDLASELRSLAEEIVVDADRLEAAQQRRARLREVRRKYGDTLADVLAFSVEAARRLEDLESHEARAATLDAELAAAEHDLAATAAALTKIRTTSATALGRAVNAVLPELAMPGATLTVDILPAAVGEEGADDIVFLLAANPGESPRPLAKSASGGELSRIMLALRLSLPTSTGTDAPPTVVFDEVDAGIGGEAGTAVGRALAVVARDHQVLCVTHLASVAAYAGTQLSVVKEEADARTISRVELLLDDDARARELSRMLAGIGESEHARNHAVELLTGAGRERTGERT